jgi:hypothetical protein
LGCLRPVRRWRWQAHRPSGVPVLGRAQRCDSLGNPLLGFASPTRCCPSSPPPISRSEAPLLGFLPLQRSRRRESTSRRFPGGLPGLTQVVAGGPTRRLRCRSQVFPTSQRLLPLSAAPPFSDGWRSWGSPYRGLILTRSPDDSSPSACPLDVSPTDCASPVPRRGNPQARLSLPRMSRTAAFCRLQGLRLRVNRSASPAIFTLL